LHCGPLAESWHGVLMSGRASIIVSGSIQGTLQMPPTGDVPGQQVDAVPDCPAGWQAPHLPSLLHTELLQHWPLLVHEFPLEVQHCCCAIPPTFTVWHVELELQH
jgi:hypothetical protein